MPQLSCDPLPVDAVLLTGPDPFVHTATKQFWFDARRKNAPLGPSANALMGLAQHQACWTQEDDQDIVRIKNALERLLARFESMPTNDTGYVRQVRDRFKSQLPCPAHQLVNHYITLSILEQFEASHHNLANSISDRVKEVAERHSSQITETILAPFDFRFEFRFTAPETATSCWRNLQSCGILATLDRDRSQISFELNLSFRTPLFDLFFERLELGLSLIDHPNQNIDSVGFNVRNNRDQLEFHQQLIHAKLARDHESFSTTEFIQKSLSKIDSEITGVILDQTLYAKFRDQILEIQSLVYEPARRTLAEEFDMLFATDQPLAILALKQDKIVAMVFAGQLNQFGQERGVTEDPFFEDRSVYYSMDLTVLPEYRGGMGRLMKQALVLLAIEHGVSAIHGRNRDRLAAGMWAINLSLGAYELQRLNDDYPDNEPHRDCIYYRCPLQWDKSSRLDHPSFEIASLIQNSISNCFTED